MTTIGKVDIEIGEDIERVSTRDFMRNMSEYKKILDKTGKTIIITKQNVDELIIRAAPKKARKSKYTMKDLMSLRFNSGKKDLSQQIDKIVYGV